MEVTRSSLRKTSDAWEKQNDTRNQRAHNRIVGVKTYALIPRDKSFH